MTTSTHITETVARADYCAVYHALLQALDLFDSLTDDSFEDNPENWTTIDDLNGVVLLQDRSICLD